MASLSTINRDLIDAEYAVLGPIVTRSIELAQDLERRRKAGAKDKKYPFDKLILCNVGNPQAFGNPVISFPRKVLALLCNPSLLESPDVEKNFPIDAIKRAQKMVAECKHTGGYSPAQGWPYVRQLIADAITQRDNKAAGRVLAKVKASQVIMTNGASEAIMNILHLVINNHKDGVMCPIPQYPLYSASIALYGGALVPYFLDEPKGYSIDAKHLEDQWWHAKSLGITSRALVVINPGNPSGRILDRTTMIAIIDFCFRHNVMLIADEVYQDNVYVPGVTWHSFREIMYTMGDPFAHQLQLCSLHSASKGMYGECGRRGGYMQLDNFPANVVDVFMKLPGMSMCANLDGQWMMELIMNPPKPGDASYESHTKEITELWKSFRDRAEMVPSRLNKIEHIHCAPTEGAFYALARIDLPPRYIERALRLRKEPDFVWCYELMETTGVVTLPGSGFGQIPGTYHFRTTILPKAELMEEMLGHIRRHMEKIWRQEAEGLGGRPLAHIQANSKL